jgi:hypothetical protein
MLAWRPPVVRLRRAHTIVVGSTALSGTLCAVTKVSQPDAAGNVFHNMKSVQARPHADATQAQVARSLTD